MVTKARGVRASDGSLYATVTDGSGTLITSPGTATTNIPKPSKGSKAPDGSIYITLTDGAGNLQ